ncbi:hypothetical protein Slin15195_G122930 [Septoria linicola]|uniref:Uncharacterized protein n=1 Tax=Septoria linicola TaxID=215465 RepID=A0A9Q9B134_9PEZI|nr:hypothetical protein Slin14017_G079130 [Septoria linicola]USW58974.1 hypothetical protein Slin15195_G122930 [Septoria linicola]
MSEEPGLAFPILMSRDEAKVAFDDISVEMKGETLLDVAQYYTNLELHTRKGDLEKSNVTTKLLTKACETYAINHDFLPSVFRLAYDVRRWSIGSTSSRQFHRYVDSIAVLPRTIDLAGLAAMTKDDQTGRKLCGGRKLDDFWAKLYPLTLTTSLEDIQRHFGHDNPHTTEGLCKQAEKLGPTIEKILTSTSLIERQMALSNATHERQYDLLDGIQSDQATRGASGQDTDRPINLESNFKHSRRVPRRTVTQTPHNAVALTATAKNSILSPGTKLVNRLRGICSIHPGQAWGFLDGRDPYAMTDFINLIDGNWNRITLHYGQESFASFMLASACIWTIDFAKDGSRMSMYAALHEAVNLYLARTGTFSLVVHAVDQAVMQDSGRAFANSWYYVLYGMYVKGLVDPPGAQRVCLDEIVLVFGPQEDRNALVEYEQWLEDEHPLPDLDIDWRSSLHHRLWALKDWLQHYPQKTLYKSMRDTLADDYGLPPANPMRFYTESTKDVSPARVVSALAWILRNGTPAQAQQMCMGLSSEFVWYYRELFCAHFADDPAMADFEEFCKSSDLAVRLGDSRAGEMMMSSIISWTQSRIDLTLLEFLMDDLRVQSLPG